MRPTRGTILIEIIILFILMGHLFSNVTHAGDCYEWVAKIVSVQGDVQAKKAGTTQWVSAQLDDTFCPGDMLRVQQRSRAGIILSNESVTRLDQNTSVTFKEVVEKKVSFIDILKGAAHFFSRVPRSLKFSTPFVNGAVEGTEFLVQVSDDQTLVSVFRGRVLAANDEGSISLGNGQSAITREGKAPASHLVVNPRDAVKWAVYYPAVIDYKAVDFEGSDDTWQGKVRKSIRFYREGNLTNAFTSLDGVPKSIRDARFYTYRSGLLLTVGRVDEANADINKALSLDVDNSNALALQTIIAVAHNKKEEALDLANKAVATDSGASAAKVALSYAQQAGFNVEGALKSLQEAVKLSPEDALAHARLSELWMSVGDLDKALVEAQNAATLNPNLARTQTVLGFAYLAQIKIRDAKAAFEKALQLDQAAPLPRLGLGLAKIREGDLKPGRVELEIAAGLDPNSSLIRSYLGKAFFDEKRDKQSNSQLAIAKELDPQDPTPWFYDAIRKQTLNRPVEALRDLQKSIELNENRAVYRSQLLLDEDLATRGASLGRIYNDLGFQALALNEGYKSLSSDPSSHSAHRLLADSYAARPRHEVARVSELLQSQLLQPVNITPVQPHLAQTNPYILEGAGPAEASFNEFNPLFLRNRLALQASGVAGSNDTYGDEVVQSGVCDRVSYSVGQFHYRTDGFRDNNDQKMDIYNAFTQVSLSEKTSMQVEYRYHNREKGDLELTFTDQFTTTLRDLERMNSIRFGLHHAFSPRSDILASFIYRDVGSEQVVFPGFFEFEGEADEHLVEIGYLFHSGMLDINAGVGHLRIDQELTTIFMGSPSKAQSDIKHNNVYLYSQIDFPQDICLTIGASVDFIDTQYIDDEDQFNPKLGLTWNPFPATTLRAAIFRTLQRPFLSEQERDPTLEPTHVAGFSQFYSDLTGWEAWGYGVGADQKISHNLYGGIELFARDLEINAYSTVLAALQYRDWDERSGRVYMYWTLSPRLALSAEYLYEWFERKEAGGFTGIEQFEKLRTHRVPLAVRYFDIRGLSASLKATYIYQDGDFTVPLFPSGFSVVSDDDQFWVVDASLGYRLPNRWGLLKIEGKNLLDKEFHFQDTDPGNPFVLPERVVFFKFTLAF